MREPTFANLDCSIARTFVMVRDAWSFLILRDALGGIRQFEDFRLRLGIARNVLTERLKHLVEFELLEKVDIGKRGLRFEYVPTGKAKELQVALMSLMQWGDRWASGRGNEPVIAFDKVTGSPISPIQMTSKSGRQVQSDELTYRAGRGASQLTRRYLAKRTRSLRV
jgi:DNA-binding HxlR family transcriptional regulator